MEERKNEITRRIQGSITQTFSFACRGCSITPVNFTESRLVFDRCRYRARVFGRETKASDDKIFEALLDVEENIKIDMESALNKND